MKDRSRLLGIVDENAVLGIVIGVCPVLAVTRGFREGLALGLVMTAVLCLGCATVGLFRRFITVGFKLPFFMLTAAFYASLCELYLQSRQPAVSRSLGVFLPLLAVNCLVMWRMDLALDRDSWFGSVRDGLFYGVGFLIAVLVVSLIREFLGTGAVFGWTALGPGFRDWPVLFFQTPAGAFFTLGLLVALYRKLVAGGRS